MKFAALLCCVMVAFCMIVSIVLIIIRCERLMKIYPTRATVTLDQPQTVIVPNNVFFDADGRPMDGAVTGTLPSTRLLKPNCTSGQIVKDGSCVTPAAPDSLTFHHCVLLPSTGKLVGKIYQCDEGEAIKYK